MKYIKGFDGLRAFSIFLVVATHLDVLLYLPYTTWFRDEIIALFTGRTGVNIFFVLSGFLITGILLNEKISFGKINFKKFYIRRFLRLLPPLIIFYLIFITLILSDVLQCSAISIVYSFFYIFNFAPNAIYNTEIGHTWSLGVEEQFYLLWPFIISILKFKRVILLAFILISLCIYVLFHLHDICYEINYQMIYLNQFYTVDRWFIPAIAPIMMGSVFSILSIYYHSFLNKLFKNSILIILLSIALFVSVVYVPNDYKCINYIVQSIGVALLITWLYFNQQSWICSVLEFTPIAYLGRISYGLYIYQGVFLRTGPGSTIWFQQFPVNIIFTLIITILSYELIEKRILKYKKHFTNTISE